MKFFILFCVLFASLSIVGLSSDAFAECSLSDTCHAHMIYNPSTSIQGLEYSLDSPATITTLANSNILSVTLTDSQKTSVFELVTPQLDVNLGALEDIAGNAINELHDQSIIIIN